MSARVEYRLGSIFDEECDVLVIPASAGGTVSPSMGQQLREAGIPYPRALPWGTISLAERDGHAFRPVAYAAAVQGGSSSREIVEKIARELGALARTRPNVWTIAAPLLGAGSGDLPPAEAAAALERGFLSTAPDCARLVISIQRVDVLEAVTDGFPRSGGAGVPGFLSALEYGAGTATGTVLLSPPPAAALSPEEVAAEAARALEVSPGPRRTRVFISYCHEDEEWLERLQKHLRPLERDGALIWDDTRMAAGAQWRREIRAALAETKVAVLLVSADFLASDFIVKNELPPLLQAAEEDGATILPVIISSSRFDRTESLSRFQAVNDPDKPLAQLRWANRERVLDQVARAVEDALKG